jgi:FMN reductase [NAD(P)H]
MKVKESVKSMNTLDAIAQRASIRSYQKEQISNEALKAIIAAGQNAPNAGPFQISVIQNVELLKKLSQMSKTGMLNSNIPFLVEKASLPNYDPIYAAPTVILLSAPDSNPYSSANTACAAENMIIAATDLGLGTCYMISLHWLFPAGTPASWLPRPALKKASH